MRIAIGIIGIAIAMIIFPIILTGANSIVTDDQTDSFAAVVDSGTPNYTATVVLTQDLYHDSTSWIQTITSNSGTDTPVAGTYTAASGSLTVTGLNAGAPGTASRTLTVNYQYDAVDTYSGMDSIVRIAPLVIFSGLVFGSGAMVYTGYRARKSGNKAKRDKYS